MRRIPDVSMRPSIVITSRIGIDEHVLEGALVEIGRHRVAFSPLVRTRRMGTAIVQSKGSGTRHEWFQRGPVVTSLTAHGNDQEPDAVESSLEMRRARAPGDDTHQLIVEMASMEREAPDALRRLDHPLTPWRLMVCAEACVDASRRSGAEDMPPPMEEAILGLAMEMHDRDPIAPGRTIRIHGPTPWARTAWSIDDAGGRPTPIDDSTLPTMARIFVTHRTDMTHTSVLLDCYSTAIDPRSVDPVRRLRLAAALDALRNGDIR